ncbi:MAG: sulfite exporter TauE/SafE family protein [Firmicutes bacterium]|nr:sulfite exporter TauE/SafE family protein [Bacillota bacterium]
MQFLWMVFLAGIAGGFGHCIGMCGGVVAACSFAGCAGKPKIKNTFLYQLFYHGGRLTTYSLIGAIFGSLGAIPSLIQFTRPYQQWVPIVAGLFMVAIGIAMAFGWGSKGVVIKDGSRSSLFARAASKLADRGIFAALPLGLFMGFLPCGLLAVIELRALASGSAISGAAAMLFFGLGTIPGIAGFGLVSGILGSRARGNILKAGAFVVIIIGLLTVMRGTTYLGGFKV